MKRANTVHPDKSEIETKVWKQGAFEDLVERFKSATDPKEVKRLRDELGRMIFS